MKISEIKNEHATLISQGVKNAFRTDSWELEEIITRGLSPSSVYKLMIDGKNYVAKISDPNNPHNNLSREYHAMSTAAKSEVAPMVYYADPDAGIIIMDYINMVWLNKAARQKPSMIKKFAAFVKRLHACDNFQKDDSIFQRVEIIYDQLPLDLKEAKLVKHAIEAKDKVQKYLVDINDLRPSHSDINPYNLLFDGRNFWLVDWVAAAQENFYFDLASCATFFYFRSDAAAEAFLNAYFERSPNQHEKDKFYLMKLFVSIYYGIMFVYISGIRKLSLLSQEEIDNLPSYSQFMDSIGEGKINLGDGIIQQQFGFIYLKMAMSAYNNENFTTAMTRLQSNK